MRSLLRVLGLAVLLPAMTAAQQIRGVVVEDSSGLPISGATIELLATDATVRATTSSAVTGWFELNPQSSGQFLVRASHTAYRNVRTLVVVLGPQEVITVVVRLSGGPIPLEPLVVKASVRDGLSGYRERARRGAFGRFITRADIDRDGAYSLAHVLRFTPEVRIERVMLDGLFPSEGVFMRSFGDMCVPTIFLNGFAVPTGRAFDINELLNVEEVEGIEVYRSSLSAPMEFRLGDPSEMWCGVIAVWSRPLRRAPITLKRLGFAGLLVGVPILFGRLLR